MAISATLTDPASQHTAGKTGLVTLLPSKGGAIMTDRANSLEHVVLFDQPIVILPGVDLRWCT